MINMPSIVTEQGDIRFHAKEGVMLQISFQDQDGNPRDMTGATVNFYVEGFQPITLTAGNTTDEMVLTIAKGTFDALIGKSADFVLVDETAVPPNIEWTGNIMITGFA